MAELNPDPYKDGDPLGATGRVTAIFSTMADLKAALSDVKSAGFKSEDTAVFSGATGEIQLDITGQIRNIEGLKIFQNALCDEQDIYEEFERALKVGETVVAISVKDDKGKKEPLAALLKSHHARKINYWGKWQNEGLG